MTSTSRTNIELRGDRTGRRFYSGAVIEDVDPGDSPDDSPWRPGAGARFEHPPIRPFDERPTDADAGGPPAAGGDGATSDTSPGSVGGPSRRRGLAAVLVLPLAIVGIAVVARGDADVPSGDIEVAADMSIDELGAGPVAARDLGGDVLLGAGDVPLLTAADCPVQRLPSAIDLLWDVELPDARRMITPVAVGEQSVVAVVGLDDPDDPSAVSVVALNTADGQERWRVPLASVTDGHEIVGIIDGSVIVRSARGPDGASQRLYAFDEVSGSPLWDRGFRGEWSAAVNATTGLVYARVRRAAVSSIGESEVEVVEPRSGDRVHVAPGAFVGLDPDGRLITRLGDKVLATSVKARDMLGLVDPSDSPFTVVGSQVLVADRAADEVRVFSGDGDARSFALVGSTGIDAPGDIVSLDPHGGSSLIVNGGGSVHGAQVGDDTVEIRWRVRGVALESALTDRGRSLLIATEGGAQQRVIDSSTGRTIVGVELWPGSLDALALVANGVVVQDSVDGEPFRVAVDLDGRELWTLAGSGALAVGSGVIVDVDDSNTVVRLSAWGDPEAARTGVVGCRSVMTEWTPR